MQMFSNFVLNMKTFCEHIKYLQSYEKINTKMLSEIWQPQVLNCGTPAYKCKILGNDLYLSKFSILN